VSQYAGVGFILFLMEIYFVLEGAEITANTFTGGGYAR
jgi:hypothetical protein